MDLLLMTKGRHPAYTVFGYFQLKIYFSVDVLFLILKGKMSMNLKTKIGILGGDTRQAAVCSLFARLGVECALWGIDCKTHEYHEDSIVRSADWRGALGGASAVILPLPLTTDGVRLNCGKNTARPDIYIPRITEIIQAVDKDCLIFAGKVPVNIQRFSAENNRRIIDYYESEDFQIKNAVPTAEGAIAVAIREMDITLSGSNVSVIGYGRIGRTLALRLISLGCRVTCIARSKRDLAWAEGDGCRTIKLAEYRESPISYDAIFNTVPHMIFDEHVVRALPYGQLFIDLASLNGGIDSEAAENHGIRVVKALSLPGKCSPFTAGKIIFDSVKDTLSEEGIL